MPVVQGATGTVTVQFKEFGVRLTFTPTIAGDMIRLKVTPEVSTLDFANGVTLSGFRIPGAHDEARTRRMSSCAMASRSPLPDCWTTCRRTTRAAIPFLSKIPMIGISVQVQGRRAPSRPS